jgi:hypothetical protein
VKKIVISIGFMMLFFCAFSQSEKDTSVAVPLVGLHLSGQLPGGDLANRFGEGMSVGLPILYKTQKGWLIGIEGTYFFGNKVKEDPLKFLRNENGTITSSEGNAAKIRYNERGWMVHAVAGKILPLLQANKSSGVFVFIGAGYMQHRIKLIDVGRNVPQIFGDLKKGYDRLTGGASFVQGFGYMFLAKNRLANIYCAIEVFEGFTKGMRGIQYDTNQSDAATRFELLYGFRLGWVLPIYKKAPKEFYYY